MDEAIAKRSHGSGHDNVGCLRFVESVSDGIGVEAAGFSKDIHSEVVANRRRHGEDLVRFLAQVIQALTNDVPHSFRDRHLGGTVTSHPAAIDPIHDALRSEMSEDLAHEEGVPSRFHMDLVNERPNLVIEKLPDRLAAQSGEVDPAGTL